MRLIKSVRIEGFRSLLNEQLNNCGENIVFVGKNSSGKSNFLRALNVFFNGQTSPGVPLDFDRDIYYQPARKQKKRIEISVDFILPDKFNFRKGLNQLATLGAEFTVSKSWELDNLRRVSELAWISVGGNNVADSGGLARDFLSLIRFRYIPNRTVPAELLRDESQVIAGAIFKKMKEGGKAYDVLRGMSDSAGKLLTATAEALKISGAPISQPNIMTTGTLGEMLRMSGFQAIGLNGAHVRDEDWGAGHQAFFLMNLLREIDTDYSRQFGWRQACIWAVEEPESGLHHDLQTRIAKQFCDWTGDKARRLQIFTTTHSPVIAMSADSGCLVELDDVSSRLREMPVPELVRQAEDRGVTAYLHPAMAFPFNPVVVVEGGIDELVMNHVANVFGKTNIRFVSLSRLDQGESNGVDSIISYLRKNKRFISKRQSDAPLIVLLDWDVSDQQLSTAKSSYGANGEDFVIRCQLANANPVLGESFRGIERYYPENVFKGAHEDGECVIGFPAKPDGPWSISTHELQQVKGKVARRVALIKSPESLKYLLGVLKLVVRAANSYSEKKMEM